MRATLSTAILALGLPGAFSRAVCDRLPELGANGIAYGDLDATTTCINEFCAAEDISKTCGSLLLSVTYFHENGPADAETCNHHFNSIFNQCLIAKNAKGGIIINHEAQYEIHRADTTVLEDKDLSETNRGHPDLEARGSRKKKKKTKETKDTNQEKADEKKKETKETEDASQEKTSKKNKKNKKKNGKTACDPETAKPAAKKSKNLVRDVLERFLPSYLVPRTEPSSHKGKAKGKAAEADEACELKPHYKKETLHKGIDHYYFDKSEGYRTAPSYKKAPKNAKAVFDKMTDDGFFNVIEFNGPQHKTYCVGHPGRNDPREITAKAAEQGGKCVITNGNYFVLPGKTAMEWEYHGPVIEDMDAYKGMAVGWTSTDPKGKQQVGIPTDYAGYYERFDGDGGTYMYCGPSLKEELDFEDVRFCQHPPKEINTPADAKKKDVLETHNVVIGGIPGSLAHASVRADRLGTVIMGDTHKFVFAYTSTRQKPAGLDINQMRALIDTFLKEYTTAKTDGIMASKTALNMDGGGSVFVSWINEKGEQRIIAAGKMDARKEADDGSIPVDELHPRKVQTMVRHQVVDKRSDWWFGN